MTGQESQPVAEEKRMSTATARPWRAGRTQRIDGEGEGGRWAGGLGLALNDTCCSWTANITIERVTRRAWFLILRDARRGVFTGYLPGSTRGVKMQTIDQFRSYF